MRAHYITHRYPMAWPLTPVALEKKTAFGCLQETLRQRFASFGMSPTLIPCRRPFP